MVNYTLIKKFSKKDFFYKNTNIFLSFSVLLLFPIISFADISADISISATVTGNGQSSGVSNNPSGSVIVNTPSIAPTDITLSGIAYPNAKVILLLNGIEATEINADSSALFVLKLSNITSGVRVFSVAAEDTKGLRSVLVTIPIMVKDNTSTTVSNLFIPPTLSINKTSYGRGEDILVNGYSAPESTIPLNIDSQNNLTTIADNLGWYTFDIKTDSFSLGDHSMQAK